jgi:hypothetical protein
MFTTIYFSGQSMHSEKQRYFIEMDLSGSIPSSYMLETKMRQEKAVQFIAQVCAWVKEHNLTDKVGSLTITAMGQVLITCEADIIEQINSLDSFPIATIRPGVAPFEKLAS